MFDIYRITDYVKPPVLAAAIVMVAAVGLVSRMPTGGGVNFSISDAISKRTGDVERMIAATEKRSAFWNAKKLSDSDSEIGTNTARTFAVYEDGTEVLLTANQGDPAGQVLTITDRPRKEVRVLQTDIAGRPVFFQVTHYDDALQDATRREYAGTADYQPFSLTQRPPMGTETFAGNGRSSDLRQLPVINDAFAAQIQTALDDLSYFSAKGAKR